MNQLFESCFRVPARAMMAIALLTLVANVFAQLSPSPPRAVIIKAARLLDGRGGQPLTPAAVRIEGEKIAQVASSMDTPGGAQVIDLGSATLLPGLIDLHTHLTNRMGVHWEDGLTKTTPGHDALWGARNARITLMAGFTTCRDMGPTWPYVDVELRNAIEEGAVPGPRLLVAGNYVSSTGGAGDARQFSIYVDVPTVKTWPTARKKSPGRFGLTSRTAPISSRSWLPALFFQKASSRGSSNIPTQKSRRR